MNWAKASVGVFVVSAGSASMGCAMPFPQGARTVFSQSFTCPEPGVSVTARPDVPPHMILGHGADGATQQPPPDVAADPARLQMWMQMAGQRAAEIDTVGQTFQVEGCGKTALLVCGHPTVADVVTHNGAIVGSMTTLVNNEVVSAVRCVSGQPPNDGKLGLGFTELKVADVRNGSPAQRAGFVAGDQIVEVDHRRVASDAEVLQLIRAPNPAGHVVRVFRAGAQYDITLPP